jgi:hypothetical protein
VAAAAVTAALVRRAYAAEAPAATG